MRVLKKDHIKIVIILAVILTIIASFTMYLLTKNQYKDYQKRINQTISNIVQKIIREYPNVPEEEIIKVLNTTQIKINKENILEKYGIKTDEMSAIYGLENKMQTNITLNIVIILIFSMCWGLILVVYLKKRDKKLENIVKYIQEINQKNYILEIDDNTEDELSNLKNELYKITVMLKEQAELSKKDKEAIEIAVSDISHQLKTPLTSISIMLDNIKENPDMEENIKKKFVFEISRQIDWINWLVISLLKISKLDADAVILKKETIQAKKIIDTAIQNLVIPLEIKNQEIITTGNLETIFLGDFNWQLEAIINILKNCLEHTGENKKIHINFEQNNIFTKITIKDEGEGINKEDLKNIFKRFYKGKNSSENSVGIGLALAKSIIEKGNGYINCKSQEGEGTEFEIKYMS